MRYCYFYRRLSYSRVSPSSFSFFLGGSSFPLRTNSACAIVFVSVLFLCGAKAPRTQFVMNIPFYYYWGDWVSKESREFMFDSVSMYACLEIEFINMNSNGLCSCAFLSGLLFGTRVWRRKRGSWLVRSYWYLRFFF